MEKLGYKTIRTWLEEITSSKYMWRGNAQSDIRFDELEGLANLHGAKVVGQKKLKFIPSFENSSPYQFNQTLPLYRRPFAIAATVAIVMIGLFHLLKPGDMKPFLAEDGQTKEILFPDGSMAFLNAGSQISFSEGEYRDGKREVLLEGEAWFEVKKGAKFSVLAKNGHVEVLGTSFNVFSREDNFEVVCETGRVKALVGNESIFVNGGEGVKFDVETKAFRSSNNLSRPSWRLGEFYFEEANLKIVLAEISRQYGVRIVNKSEAGTFYTGLFKSGDLNKALEIVCKPLSLSYIISEEDGETSVVIQ